MEWGQARVGQTSRIQEKNETGPPLLAHIVPKEQKRWDGESAVKYLPLSITVRRRTN